MAYTPEFTEVIDPAALRTIVNSSVADIGPNLLLTGDYATGALPAAISDPIIGVTRATIYAGKGGRTAVRGFMAIYAGSGGVTKGQRVMPEAATGKVIPWSASAGANATVVGIAHTTASANGLCMVEFNCTGQLSQGA